MPVNYVRFQRGSQAAYQALVDAKNLDPNTLYFIYAEQGSTGALYLGDKLISGGDIVFTSAYLDDLADVVVKEAQTDSFLVKAENGDWVAKTLEDVVALIKENLGEIASSAQVFQVERTAEETDSEAITRIVGDTLVSAGDMVIVKYQFVAGKYQHTAYVYDGKVWVAMDGNYDATNVYFTDNFIFTKPVGTVTIPSSGSTEKEAAGKNLVEFFSSLFAEEDLTPDISNQPSVSKLTIANSGSYEVGTTVNPSFTVAFEDGKYQYGPEPTGVTVSNWKITSNNGDDISIDVTNNDQQTGNLASVTIKADTSIDYSAVATYSEGVAAKTNLGNDSSVKINAGTKSKNANGSIKGYRNTFYGTLNDKTTELTNSVIRGLNKTNKTSVTGDTFTIDVTVGALRTILAVPAGLKPSYVGHREGLNAPLLDDNTTKVTVAVDGAVAGADTIDYDVYVWTYANPYATLEHYDVTI